MKKPISTPINFAGVLRQLEDGPRRDGSAAQGPDVAKGSTAGPPGMGPDAIKVRESGGALLAELQHPSLPTIEIYDTVLPQGGMFDLPTGRNFTFEILSYQVPQGLMLLMYDYEFFVDDFSGVDPAQSVRAAPGRYINNIGFDVTVDAHRISTLRFVLQPRPIPLTKSQFDSGRSPPTSVVQARSAASASGAGSSLLPLRPEVQGARDKPFTWVAREGSTVVLTGSVFRAFTTPIASIGGRFGGYLVVHQVGEALLQRMRPQ